MIGEQERLNAWEDGLNVREHMWVLLGRYHDDLWHSKMLHMSIGSSVQVAFDANWVLKREEQKKDVVGFLHSHPGFTNHYSSRDDRTMKAWSVCFGKPVVCCIQGIDGLAAWWYLDDENKPECHQVKKIGNIIFGITPELYE